MRVSVVGCGYLGAVHAACMTVLGHDVVGIDVDEGKVEALRARRAPLWCGAGFTYRALGRP